MLRVPGGTAFSRVCLILCFSMGFSEGVAALEPDEAVRAALDAHPRVIEAEARLLAAQGRRRESVPILGNPEIEARSSLGEDRWGLGASLPLDLTGSTVAARLAASRLERSAELEVRRARLEVAAETRRAYVAAVIARQQLEIARGGHELARRFELVSERRLQVGEGSELDLRLARLGRSRAASRLLEASAAEAEAIAQLAETTATPLELESLAGDPLAGVPVPNPAADREERLDLASAREGVRAAQAELVSRKTSFLGPIQLGWEVEKEEGIHQGPSVALTLPLFSSQQGARAEARAELLVASSRLSGLEARARTETHRALGRLEEADGLGAPDSARLMEDGQRALAGIESAWTRGETDLATTLLLQASVLEDQAAALDFLGQVATARIDLLLALEDAALLPHEPSDPREGR